MDSQVDEAKAGRCDITPEFLKKNKPIHVSNEDELAYFYKLSIEEQRDAIHNHLECFYTHLKPKALLYTKYTPLK